MADVIKALALVKINIVPQLVRIPPLATTNMDIGMYHCPEGTTAPIVPKRKVEDQPNQS